MAVARPATLIPLGPLAPGALATVQHGLVDSDGRPISPNTIHPDRETSIGVVSVSNTSVTFRNYGVSGEIATFLLQNDSDGVDGYYWRGALPTPAGVVGGVAGNIKAPPGAGARNTIYVRTTGDDATGNGSLGTPYRTVARALMDLPLVIYDQVFEIDMTGVQEIVPSSGGLRMPTILSPNKFTVNSSATGPARLDFPLVIRATPTVLDTMTAVSTFDAVTGLTTLTDASKAWTTNQFRGKFAIGAGAFQYAPIASNTGTALEICSTLTFTNPVQIVDLTGEFRQADGASFSPAVSVFDNPGRIAFEMVKFTHANPSTSAFSIELASSVADFILCDIDSIAYLNTRGDTTNCVVRSKEARVIGSQPTWTNMFFFGTTFGWYGTGGAGSFAPTACIMDGCSSFGHGQRESDVGYQIENSFIRNATGIGLLYNGGNHCSARNVRINGSVNDAVRALRPGCLWLSNVVGTGNGGLGLKADDGCHVEVDSTTTVTGTGGDLQSGNMAARTWTNFRGSAPVKNEFDVDASTGTGARVWQP